MIEKILAGFVQKMLVWLGQGLLSGLGWAWRKLSMNSKFSKNRILRQKQAKELVDAVKKAYLQGDKITENEKLEIIIRARALLTD